MNKETIEQEVDDIGKLELKKFEMKRELRGIKEHMDEIEHTAKKVAYSSPQNKNEQQRRAALTDMLATQPEFVDLKARSEYLDDQIALISIKIRSDLRKFEDEKGTGGC